MNLICCRWGVTVQPNHLFNNVLKVDSVHTERAIWIEDPIPPLMELLIELKMEFVCIQCLPVS